ncbi:hypothetical protein [Haloferax chudinovii]|uniref:Uncharacterized protein n=1 Tax=Haloferax chudinovii TaxID=1109010 RepID=A0ABD5XGD1_9EURY
MALGDSRSTVSNAASKTAVTRAFTGTVILGEEALVGICTVDYDER